MFSRQSEYQSFETTKAAEVDDPSLEATVWTPTRFHGCYQDSMEMNASAVNVAEYLNSHASWFSRCAEPMKVEPLGENGYALVIGRFGAFGYDVEPKIGLELLPPEEGVYRIRTIPIPDYQAPGYEVDYNAALNLVQKPNHDASSDLADITLVMWELDLTVYINFPKFIQRLPKSLIQSTGDRLLNQVVRQVSRRLTRKVQEDFHQSFGIRFPV
ncbi:DUF1997 domain-containing protein [Aetokthonos hydrillicola Thurmond2011]|jgi:hypothetical protein|uniref:DUF1997 domain-containing protein n=1 Tax=Aetokthonos hydrillicola Thurmond2011 TaxID=2712845 RepID=A0AAP5I7T3_9CYAN|nr:DUF1997 domain-containing protein [Aetokthonos hydrillicola]MBO3457270.1 DUF1997 domain-containing protein [Aetokthonos hydrillicola CCALA 1050]MBW4586612.1 DUF1997 domain-containing protein [Aetokthonos hydrillicola CCALA 1050]MDR9894060.1 DUF1997 domain-containing protein [Aetokthonos hydrillicola Thurmond2011]